MTIVNGVGLYCKKMLLPYCSEVGFVAQINDKPSHQIVLSAIKALNCMEHRGGCSSDSVSGDGAGITTQIPWNLLLSSFSSIAKDDTTAYAVAMIFVIPDHLDYVKNVFEWILLDYGFSIIGWRLVPTNSSVLGHNSSLYE